MEAEHCSKGGCCESFVKSNKKSTTPQDEWAYVVKKKDCQDLGRGRKFPDIDALMNDDLVKKANLSREEVIAVVMYTGPMFKVYNCILRRYPQDLFQRFKEHDNLFSTTIFVIASSVKKLSLVTSLPEDMVLYRGLDDLPDSFYNANEMGCKGFAEWGFMSTTSDKNVALQYSGLKHGRQTATVLVIRVGAVDRGACVSSLSQYPIENEYLWLPCSWVEQRGPETFELASMGNTSKGLVRMIPCDIHANLQAKTTDKLLCLKKDTHIAAFSHLVDYLHRQLEDAAVKNKAEARLHDDRTRFQDANKVKYDEVQWTVDGLVKQIVSQCREVLEQHKRIDAARYADEGRFRGLILAMAERLQMALSKLHGWVEDTDNPICYLFSKPLRVAHRERIAFLWRTLPKFGEGRRRKAEELCKVRGLIEGEVNEENELGESRLMTAAADGRSPADLRLLAAAGVEVNLPDKEGSTALHGAAAGGYVECVQALVALRASIDAIDRKGRSPIFEAAKYGQVECIRALAEARADINLRNRDGATGIFVAAQRNHAGCIRMLAEHGANVDIAIFNGVTPLWMAAQESRLECIRALLEFGANEDVKCNGKTALQRAKKCPKCVEELSKKKDK